MLCKFSDLGSIAKVEAQIQFLEVIRKMPYGNCLFYRVRTVGYFPVDLPDNTELRLGINYHNVHFFHPNMHQCLVSIEASNLFACTWSGQTLSMKIGWITEWCSFQLETDHGEEICKAVQTYKREFQRTKSRLQTKGWSKLMAVHPMTDSPSPRKGIKSINEDWTSEGDTLETDSSQITSGDETSRSGHTDNRETSIFSRTQSRSAQLPSLDKWRQARQEGSHPAATGKEKSQVRHKTSRLKQIRKVATHWDTRRVMDDSEPQTPTSTMSDEDQISNYTTETQPLAVQADTEKTKW